MVLFNSNNFKLPTNLIISKSENFKLENFEIKYGVVGFELGNNFTY
jgi:hypothetical protein